jgi:hypothetical protein
MNEPMDRFESDFVVEDSASYPNQSLSILHNIEPIDYSDKISNDCLEQDCSRRLQIIDRSVIW